MGKTIKQLTTEITDEAIITDDDSIEIQRNGQTVTAQIKISVLRAAINRLNGGLTQLATPTLTATVIGSTQIDLSWTNVANESSYLLQRSPDNSTWTTIDSPVADDTAFSDTGLTPSTLYYYRIKAVGDGVTYSDSAYGTDSDTTSAAAGGLPHTSPFTAANGTLLNAYTPTAGNGWVNSLGTGEIQSNKAVPLTLSTGEWQTFTDLEDTEYTITTVVAASSGSITAYLFFRRVDGSNMMFITLDFGANLIKAWKVVAGAVTQVGSNVTPSPTIGDTADHTFVLTVGATTFSLTVDGNAAFTGEAIDAAASGDLVGIGATGLDLDPGEVQFNSFNAVA